MIITALSAPSTTPPETAPPRQFPWTPIAWFAALLIIGYLPVLRRLMHQWMNDEDMGHGFFVPVIALYIVWQYKDDIMALRFEPSKWGLVLVAVSGAILILATLGAELFLARLSFVLTLIGVVWTVGGRPLLRLVAFP